MSFRDDLTNRPAAVYADFLLPHLRKTARVLDCGCGSGSIAVGLGGAVAKGTVVGVDVNARPLRAARRYVHAESIEHVHFVAADGTALPFGDATFDAALCHSVLEVASQPVALLREVQRVLVPGGVVAVASVDYGGLILSGPGRVLLERFYKVRERLWRLDTVARPRAGRELRRLLADAGFIGVRGFARYLSYGTPDRVRAFGMARARDCQDPWYAASSVRHGLLSVDELRRIKNTWAEWSRSPRAFAAFAWCRAIGHKPPRRRPRSRR